MSTQKMDDLLICDFAPEHVRIKLPGIRYSNGKYRTQSGDREIFSSTYEMIFLLPKDAKTIQDVYKANSWIENSQNINGVLIKEWEFVKVYIDNYLLRKELLSLKTKFNAIQKS